MADIQIWNGSATFSAGMTPFGFYDSDADFQAEAVKVAKYCATRLGYPMMDVELTSGSFFACFEEAVTTYGNLVFQYKIRENYLSMEGASSETTINDKIVTPSLQRAIKISQEYGTEAEVGGKVTRYTGSLAVTASIQDYDLDQWATDNSITGGIEIRRVFYESPPAILRYFDPYAGTGTGIQSLMETFGFGNYSPGVNFMLMPIYYDALKVQAIEFNDQLRKSAYSFEITNNDRIKLFPRPARNETLYFDYFVKENRNNVIRNTDRGLITDVSNVPYSNISYNTINTPGKQWIFRYTLAIAKEMLASVRGKYSTVPIPGSEVTTNAGELRSEAAAEKTALIDELKLMLEESSRAKYLEREAAITQNTQDVLTKVPYPIYIA